MFTFPSSYCPRIPTTLNWPRQSLGGACQSSKMAALLNSLSFAFKNSFLPKYRAKYYDYIVKWCSGIHGNWCVSMDISYILALNMCALRTSINV